MGRRQDQSEELSQAAVRQRRYRQRRRAGIQVVSVEVGVETVDMLVTKGRLTEQDTLNPMKIADALLELAEQKTVGSQPPERPLSGPKQTESNAHRDFSS